MLERVRVSSAIAVLAVAGCGEAGGSASGGGDPLTPPRSEQYFAFDDRPPAIPFELHREGTDVVVRVELARPLGPENRRRLEALVAAWYELGFYTAFGDSLTFLGDTRATGDGRRLSWHVDAGAADDGAFTTLRWALEGFAHLEGVDIARIVIR